MKLYSIVYMFLQPINFLIIVFCFNPFKLFCHDNSFVRHTLDALKWDKAVLVGCDDDSCLALETAMELAPERVAGLILCGDLTTSNQFAQEAVGEIFLDSFLHRALDCPFVIVWDGGARSVVSGSSVHEAIETKSSPFGDGADGRCVILVVVRYPTEPNPNILPGS